MMTGISSEQVVELVFSIISNQYNFQSYLMDSSQSQLLTGKFSLTVKLKLIVKSLTEQQGLDGKRITPSHWMKIKKLLMLADGLLSTITVEKNMLMPNSNLLLEM